MTTEISTLPAPPPRSIVSTMASRYFMEPGPFEATLRATVCKGSVSREEFAAFLIVAKEYGLNPLTKELYAFPAKGGGIQPIVSIDGWARIINDHPAFDGMEFDDVLSGADVVAVTCRMFRKDRSHPIEATEYLVECKRSTDVWKQWPRRMLRHKAMIQCARYAFGFSGIVDADEFERMEQAPRQGDPSGPKLLHSGFDTPEAETPATQPPHDPDTGEIVEGFPQAVDAIFEEPSANDQQASPEPSDGAPSGMSGLPLNDRITAFKERCLKAGSPTKLGALWAASSLLRDDLTTQDPDALVELTQWWQALYDTVEASVKGA